MTLEDLIKAQEDAIKAQTEATKLLNEISAEIERLKAAEAEVKPWRAEIGNHYCLIKDNGATTHLTETGDAGDDDYYEIVNYYRTEELAEQDAKELALRGRLRQLRDDMCEGYEFNPNRDGAFTVAFSGAAGLFMVYRILCDVCGAVYFDSEEHAQKAADILNAEMGWE